jgi:uncharacterized protein with von Willebrand factor type A (vWA) domain
MTDEPLEDWLSEEAEGGVALKVQEGEGEPSGPPPTPYALNLDNWGKRQGRNLVGREAFTELALPEEDLADLYGMSFEAEPEVVENCADPIKHEFIKALQDNPEYQALHGETQWDTDASEIAALHFSKEYHGFRATRKEQHAQDAADPTGKAPTPQQQLQREMEALASVNKAAENAAEEVKEFNDMKEAMGCGKGDGSGSTVPSSGLKRMFKQMKNNQVLQDICATAGRYRRLARSKQRQKVSHGYDDMVGVVFDNDISRMLASELAQMGSKKLRGEAIRRFVEKEMLCRDYRGVENVGKGPIIFLIDESGSMSGDPIVNAKAMALSMAWVAKSQNRWCALVGWSSAGQVREIVLPPGKWDHAALMAWLPKMFNGGTDFPMGRIPELYREMGAPKGKTDMIVLTDGEWGHNSPQDVEVFKRWKQEAQTRTIGISLAADSNALKAISDDYYRISGLSVEDEAVGRALSI